MDEFSPIGTDPMSNDETTKIEPVLIVKDAPPVASEQPDLVGPFKPASGLAKAAADEVKIEAPAAAAAPAAKTEPPKIEATKIELSSQAPLLPPAPQLEPIAVAPKQ